MPISPSAKKSLRSSLAKKSQNVAIKIELKKAIKNLSEKNISDVISKIDKAAKNHIIHHNKASRLKARIAKLFPNAVPAPKSTSETTKKTKKTASKKPTKESTPAKTKSVTAKKSTETKTKNTPKKSTKQSSNTKTK